MKSWIVVFVLLGFAMAFGQKPWRVMVDKGTPPTIAATAKTLVPVQKPNQTLLLPTTASEWALSGWMDGYKAHRTVLHNLRTGESGKPVKWTADTYTFSRLSPDGRHLIGRHSIKGGWTIGVWETRTGKLVWMDREGEGVLPWNDFVDDKRIVEVSGKYMKVWNVATDKLEHKITPVAGLAVSGSVFTPNRKFLARLETGGVVRLYTMPEGALAGELPRPKLDGRTIETAFMDVSQDGLELALAMRVSRVRRDRTDDRWIIAAWDLRTGKQNAQHELPRDLVASLNTLADGYEIDCLPDRSGWLFRGAGLIERSTGQLVWAVPRPTGIRRVHGGSLFLTDGRLAVHHSGGGPGGHKLHLTPLPNDLAKRVATLKAGRELPDLKAALVSKSNHLGGVDWAVIHKRTDALKQFPAKDRKPLPNDELGRHLVQVLGKDIEASNLALEALGRARPNPDQATRVVQAVETVARRSKNPFYSTAGWWVINEWKRATPQAAVRPQAPAPVVKPAPEPAPPRVAGKADPLAADLESGDFRRVVKAMRELATRGDAEAAELIAAHYSKHRAFAGKALQDMGEKAAPATAGMLESKEWSVRIDALRFLAKIGTKSELPAVERVAASDPNRLVQMKAKETAAAIRKR